MAWTEWVQTDDYQWQRKDGDLYEMYDVIDMIEPEEHPYFAGGGRFKLSDYDDNDVSSVLSTFGYGTIEKLERIYGDRAKDVLAECLFEHDFMGLEPKMFPTAEDGVTYVKKLMGEEE